MPKHLDPAARPGRAQIAPALPGERDVRHQRADRRYGGHPAGRLHLGPLIKQAPNAWQKVGLLSKNDFPIGKTVLTKLSDPSSLPWAGQTSDTSVWVRQTAPSQFDVFAVNCTHLGCPVNWLDTANLFECPCHGGIYYANGDVAAGPPPRGLFRHEVRVQGDEVQVLDFPAADGRLMASRHIPLPHLPKHIWLTVGGWFEDRSHIYEGLLPIIQHPVPKLTRPWWYVFGSATLVAFIVQVVTGVALAFTYVPAPNGAYDSLEFITHGPRSATWCAASTTGAPRRWWC